MLGKRINYLELSYPNFQLGQIINPDEVNQNNADIQDKVNEFVDEVEEALDIAEHAENIANTKGNQAIDTANIANQNSQTAINIANDAVTTATNLGNEAKNIANNAVTTATNLGNEAKDIANNAVTTAETLGNHAIQTANQAHDMATTAVVTSNDASGLSVETRQLVDQALLTLEDAIRRAEQAVIDAQSAVGNTSIHYDVYVVVNADNGDGTFTYKDGDDNEYIGEITPEGYQRFHLSSWYYPHTNRIEAKINDTLHRSQASGGLREVGVEGVKSNLVDLTYPVSDAEVTFKYYSQISLGGKHAMQHNIGGSDAFIQMSPNPPSTWYAGQLFFKEV